MTLTFVPSGGRLSKSSTLIRSQRQSCFLSNRNPSFRAAPRRLTVSATATAQEISSRSPPVNNREYDYVIIGGGSGGCVLADRLSEDPKKSVLVLEAGKPDDKMYIHIPLGFPYLCGSDVDWRFMSEPEEKLNNRRIYFPRGKVLGGSHSISVMLYHRGSARDYEIWEEEYGAEGWGPHEVLPFFKRSEDQQRGRSTFHGRGGPLAVSDLKYVNPMVKSFFEACGSEQFSPNDDFNDWSRDQEGYGTFQVTQRDGSRESPATSYLRRAMNRRNLTVETGVVVEQINIEPGELGNSAKSKATGVTVINKDGHREVICAKNEVLLAGGAFASPQLLMLSGIGPGEHLRSFGIEVKQDLQGVGKNLQDHASVLVSHETKNPLEDKRQTRTFYSEQTGKDLRNLAQFFLSGSGPLTSNMCEAGGFFRTDPSYDSPDLQLRFVPFFSEPDPYFSMGDFASGGSYLKNKSNRKAGFTVQAVTARPRSVGHVELASADVRSPMAIHANWLSDERDLHTLVNGLKLIRNLAAKESFEAFRGKEAFPGAETVSDADLIEYVKSSCHTANALVGTCRMGRLSDPDSVVDTRLRVKGVSGLRVVDSSVMPKLPGGQAGAPTMMIAERAADFIREDHA